MITYAFCQLSLCVLCGILADTTAAPAHIGVFETSQCDRVWGDALPSGNSSIICEGADPTHLFFLKFGVDVMTGVSARNDTILKGVMTPRPYYLRYSQAK
jgi:hypothetical protein